MLVHDIRSNKTQVIDFRETAPSSLGEEMLEANLELKVGDCVPVSLHICMRLRYCYGPCERTCCTLKHEIGTG